MANITDINQGIDILGQMMEFIDDSGSVEELRVCMDELVSIMDRNKDVLKRLGVLE